MCANFNSLYIAALRAQCTHFLMLSDDVCPIWSPGRSWFHFFAQEFENVGAEILASVIAIKDAKGRVSTALETDDEWRPDVLTLARIKEFGEITFTRPNILLNGGLMLWRRAPWSEKLCFHFEDRIRDGVVDLKSEDWNFSRDARRAGCPHHKMFATTILTIDHFGLHRWTTP